MATVSAVAGGAAWMITSELDEVTVAQIRRRNGKFGVSNAAVEQTLQAALDEGCEKLDLFFRAALLGPTWQDMLSFETEWMTREQIVATTYQVGAALNDLKHDAGLIDDATHATVADHLHTAVRVLAEVQALSTLPESERRGRLATLNHALNSANNANLVGEDELKWKTSTGIRVSWVLLRHLAKALLTEIGHANARLHRRYDTAVATPPLLPPPDPTKK